MTTTDYTITPNWQEEPPTYTKVRAIRELTAGCPCDQCEGKQACKTTGHECREFKAWCKTGK